LVTGVVPVGHVPSALGGASQVVPDTVKPVGHGVNWHGPPAVDEKPMAQIGFCTVAQLIDDVITGARRLPQVAELKLTAVPVVLSIKVAFTS
jgi:hypothetical protein